MIVIVCSVVELVRRGFSTDDIVEKLVQVEELAWNVGGSDILASKEKISKRVMIIPEGTSLAFLPTGEAVGSQYAFRLHWSGNTEVLTSWGEWTNDGNIEKIHHVDGDTGFLVGVGVIPKYRGKKLTHNLHFAKEYKASELLIALTLDNLFDAGVKQVIANARVPFYHTMPECGVSMNIDEYCAFRDKDGKLYDPVLRFHERMGAKIIKPVQYSMEDPESLNAGAWVLYQHRFGG